MSTINDRISQLVPLLSRNKNTFSKALGSSNNSLIENIVGKRQTKPGFDILHTLVKTFPQVNAKWLLTGEGEIFVVPPSLDFTYAPLISQFAHAGYLRGFADAEYLDSQPVYYPTRKYNNGKYVAFEIRGESMRDGSELSICDGDILFGREVPYDNWKFSLQTPKVFIIVHKSEGITCKEITDLNIETGEITCHCWNFDPEFLDFKINLSDVSQLFTIKEISRRPKF